MHRLPAAEIAALSRLLDEALALGAAERAAWLAGLPPEQAVHRDALARMLQHVGDDGVQAPWATLPALGIDPADDRAGETVGPWRLLRELGRGGMGSVWLAERADGAYERRVALKLPRLGASPAHTARLHELMAAERRLAARLEHPNIARLYDAGVDAQGRPFMAMEWIDGVTIDRHVRDAAPTPAATVSLLARLARAVAHAHAQGVVHRDIKPGNVLVDREGQPRLLDFGIGALLTEPPGPGDGAGAGAASGLNRPPLTPAYAAPEQRRGEPGGVPADIYALGRLAWHLLSGRRPDDTAHPLPPASRAMPSPTTARLLKGALDAIVARALAEEPGARYPSAEALADDLERWLRGAPVAAWPEGPVRRLGRVLRQPGHRRLAAAATGALGLVAAALLAGGIWRAHLADEARAREQRIQAFVAEMFRTGVSSLGSAAGPGADPKAAAQPDRFLQALAGLAEERLGPDAAMRAEVERLVAQGLAEMGAHQTAARHAERHLALLQGLSAAPEALARARLQLGEALWRSGRSDEAMPVLRAALDGADGNEPLALEALLLLARAQQGGAREEPEARARRDWTAEYRRRLPPDATATHRSWARLLLGWEAHAEGRLDEAFAHFEAATALAEAALGPGSPVVIDQLLHAAHRRAQTPARAEAEAGFERAWRALAAQGPHHLARAQIERARFIARQQGDGVQLRTQEALEQLRRLRLEQPAWPAELHDELDRIEGRILVFWGDVARGLPMLERVVPPAHAAARSERERRLVAYDLALGLMIAGRHDEADRWYRESLRARVADGGGNHPYATWDHIVVALNLSMAGRHAEALAALDAAPEPRAIQGETSLTNRYALLLQRYRAELLLHRGDVAAAADLLPLALLRSEFASDEWNVRDLLGEIECRRGRHAEGRRQVLQGLEVMRAAIGDDHPHAPWQARSQAIAGLCALGLGRREQARRHEQLAAAAFAAQPGVSEHYKRPWRELQAALR